MTSEELKELIEETVKAMLAEGRALPAEDSALPEPQDASWLFDSVDQAVPAAGKAYLELAELSMEKRGELVSAMRNAAIAAAEPLARLAHEETGYGVTAHKVAKNLLAAHKTPGTEDLHSEAFSGDFGLTLVERAPYGVIGAITPSTNPTSTIISNAISMVAAGNAVVFNPHPAAKRAAAETLRALNDAICAAGGPQNLLCTIKDPTPDTGQAVMEHRDIPLLVVTGGEAVVKIAMRVGKKVIAAGPGNPPVIVDDTAIIPKAAKHIVDGASFDNNVLCVAEKEVFVYRSVAEKLMSEMENNGAYRVTDEEASRIVETVFLRQNGQLSVNRDFVGKSASYILEQSDVMGGRGARLIIADVDETHPFVRTEMLMPVLGIVKVQSDIENAVRMAILAENGCRHTAIMHSQDVGNLSLAARALNTTIFVKNAPSFSGLGYDGEGFATFTIATPTGEGLTSAKSFTRSRRCVLRDGFRIV